LYAIYFYGRDGFIAIAIYFFGGDDLLAIAIYFYGGDDFNIATDVFLYS